MTAPDAPRAKATATPWVIRGKSGTDYSVGSGTHGDKGAALVRTNYADPGVGLANAELIIAAVNAYAANQETIWELAKACKALLNYAESLQGTFVEGLTEDTYLQDISVARAALKRAEGAG